MSESKIDQYKQIHAAHKYGDTSIKNLRYLRPQVQILKPKTIIDFGCGQSKLIDVLSDSVGAQGTRYDPAIPKYSKQPKGKHDLLINVDVLEHVPVDQLDDVVGQMASLCEEAIIVIDTREAKAILPNGENAHCTVRSHDWWGDYLSKHFKRLEPIRVTRKSRAAFRTWSLNSKQSMSIKLMTISEKTKYILKRLFGIKGHK